MKYYNIYIKTHYGERVASSANGQNVPDKDELFGKIRKGEILNSAPVFDYFVLESFDEQKYWEWALFDVFYGRGDFPHNGNWYVSNDLKKTLENFKIAPEFHFYETKLLYKGDKYKYWIFQFIASYRKLNKMKYINFSKTLFSIKDKEYVFNSYEEYSQKNEEIYDKYEEDLHLKEVVLNQFFDFIPLNPISSNIIVSENLKEAIENMKFEGFEFTELDFKVILE
ncbi:DUF1629 domain-containing protein [Flavobacterium sp. LC2016-01]|uniref:imm11 family protein n=1 Tax=Flavobacterium sp. LC2016-01 TaxID=2675876 RepID=UPI0012BAE09A|nr:DUF1629 domain-containing protein [Flavobacterium sp. LC2016-01]MTH15802.1 hypothetical protein [Flavobacterium sp. LC2016-01]